MGETCGSTRWAEPLPLGALRDPSKCRALPVDVGNDMNVLIQLTVTGLAMGMVYALIAMGLVLLIRAVGVMNFAQGDLLMMGAFISWAFTNQVKMPLWLTVPVSILLFALIGVIFMMLVYWPLRNASYPAATVISTMGASIVIREVVSLLWGSVPLVQRSLIPGVMRIGSLVLQYQYLLIIGVGAVLIIGVNLLFGKLYAGRVMQAAAQDPYAAKLLGIPTQLTIAITYAIVVIIVGLSGWLVSPVFSVSLSLGSLQLRAFAGVILGGFGNIQGAIVGSFIVGLLETYGTLVTTTYKDALVFGLLIVVLIFRPNGLLGKTKVFDKA